MKGLTSSVVLHVQPELKESGVYNGQTSLLIGQSRHLILCICIIYPPGLQTTLSLGFDAKVEVGGADRGAGKEKKKSETE